MLRLSLRRRCASAAAAVAGVASASSDAAPTTRAAGAPAPPPPPPPTTLPDFYGKSFSISPRTWAQISWKNNEEGFSNDARYLRLAIDSGGCHGYLYKFSFETNTDFNREEDIAIAETDAVAPDDASFSGAQPSPRVVVDTLSASKLENATLDYHSELKGSAFVVVGNELVDQSCACAMSFSLKKKTRSPSSAASGASAGRGRAGHTDSAAAATEAAASAGPSASQARPITRRATPRASA
ncbi:Iron-sulfur assembly protein 2 [Novymonas esmeraldas]|uniref:Iron-sulfur assembly protein 2 n=1 Tax=Novymonas esmeraldas TaxID=1808958 RepID=A0AAW0EZB3_9TRYP